MTRRRNSVLATVLMVIGLLSVVGVASGQDLQRRLIEAQSHVRNGRLPEAIQIYQGLIAEHPEHDAVVQGLAGALRQAGRYPEALEVYRRGDEAGGRKRFVLQRVSLLKQLDRQTEALELSLDNLDTRFLFNHLRDEIVRLTDVPARWEMAHRTLSQRFDEQPLDYLGEALIEICLKGARYEEAVSVVARISPSARGGERAFSLARRLDRYGQPRLALDLTADVVDDIESPYHAEAVLFRADLEEELGMPEKAFEGLTALIQQEGWSGRRAYDVQMRRAELLIGPLGRPEEALSLFDHLLAQPSLRPSFDFIRLRRAQTQLRLERLDDALVAFRELTSESRTESVREEAEFMVGEVLFYEGQIDSAAAVFLRQVESYPEGNLANDGLERIYLFNENFGTAGEELRDLGRVLLLERTGRTGEAIGLADSLVHRYDGWPIHDELLLEAARLTAASDAPERAIGYIDSLVIRYPEVRSVPRAMQLKGKILEEALGDPAAALSVYEDLLNRHPLSIEAAEVRPRVTELRRELRS